MEKNYMSFFSELNLSEKLNLWLAIVFLLFSNLIFSQTCSTTTVSPGTAILDNTTFNTTITVSSNVKITDVNITLDVTHTHNKDLDIFLVHPDGTRVEIITDKGGNGNGFNILFDDESINSLPGNGNGDVFIEDNYIPEDSFGLATFDGRMSSGDWVLEITDDAGSDIGVLNSVSLEICGNDPCTNGAIVGTITDYDPDADGINSLCDLDNDNDGILDANEGLCVTSYSGNFTALAPSLTSGDLDHDFVNVFGSGINLNILTSFNNVGGGVIAMGTNTLILGQDGTDSNDDTQNSSVEFVFSENVKLNNFIIGDIDVNDFQDEVNVVAYDQNGTLVQLDISFGSDLTYNSVLNRYSTPSGGALYDTPEHQLNISSDTHVKRIVVTNYLGNGGGFTNPGYQAIEFVSLDFCTVLDTDSDGTPDYLDTDSDNDGCFDAIEGSGNFTIDDLTPSNNLANGNEGAVNGEGVPTNTGSPQGVGTSATFTADAIPTLIITNPTAVCSPSTVDITVASVTAGSTSGTLTYWTNSAATSSLATPTAVGAGTYYIKLTATSGCYEVEPVVVTLSPAPTADAGSAASICAGDDFTASATA
ncbi:proprotein convertase P-domain-containing protein, partial [Tenacibaculum sp. S7007]